MFVYSFSLSLSLFVYSQKVQFSLFSGPEMERVSELEVRKGSFQNDKGEPAPHSALDTKYVMFVCLFFWILDTK
jgi:hypothetical protein